MQDKNKLNNMAEKYKEEMMRLYSRKRAAPPTEVKTSLLVPIVTAEQPITQKAEPTTKEMPINSSNNNNTIIQEQRLSDNDLKPLINPPMPEIPSNYGRGAMETPHNANADTKSKFPAAEEIMRAETAVQTVATIYSDPRFEPAENLPHNQGNYNYDAPEPLEELEDYVEEIIPEIDYPDNNTELEDLFDDNNNDDNPINMKGTGYLQVEVTTGDGAVPVPKATVIVTQEINGQTYLVTMKQTNSSGATDIIPLPAPSESFSEAPDPTERPFSQYNVTVYKKGFYTVPEINVPIFDTIKSIQPVALIPLAENELQGANQPNDSSTNGGAPNA